MSSNSFTQFPEELLERILLHVVVAPAAPHPRASWHPHSSVQGKELQTRGRTAPLLVCHAFHRICLPLFYQTLVLHSPHQSASLLQALRTRPYLACSVRVLALPNPSACDAEVLSMLPKLLLLDVTLPKSSCDDAVENLGGAIRKLNTLQELYVRKSAGTYLSQPAPRAMLDALAGSVGLCKQLHSTTLTFPLSADPSLAPLSAALSVAPALRTLRTPLPSLWSAAYAEVAANPSVERVCLGGEESAAYSPVECASAVEPLECTSKDGRPQPRVPERRASNPSFSPHQRARPVLPTALFLVAARPHARLTELIRAGTDIANFANVANIKAGGRSQLPATSDMTRRRVRLPFDSFAAAFSWATYTYTHTSSSWAYRGVGIGVLAICVRRRTLRSPILHFPTPTHGLRIIFESMFLPPFGPPSLWPHLAAAPTYTRAYADSIALYIKAPTPRPFPFERRARTLRYDTDSFWISIFLYFHDTVFMNVSK
ncbi:hypothetical protein K438DRAFT_1965786 [Mycena galopus ATCC 62051]|nr:hypothetical protein K438DRAFT_1965786 [Mycena galopus ATCC 62051]